MEIYLDNAATTKPSCAALKEYVRVSEEAYGNPNALHGLGLKAEKVVENARRHTAKALSCGAEEIKFTSGGTESDNLAILGAVSALKHKGKHIITFGMEHHAVLHSFSHLESIGYDVTYIPSKPNGEADLEAFQKAVRPDTVFVSLMAVNNETGVVQPVFDIKKYAPNAVVHTDCVQAFGKIPLNPDDLNVDLMSFSGHKIHAVKGVGALYVRKGVKINPITFGGDQEGIRSGTLNTAGIAAFGVEAENIAQNGKEIFAGLKEKRDYLEKALKEEIPDVVINGENAVHIVNAGFDGVRGEVLLHALENAGIYVSTGSACTSKATKISHVLESMGVKQGVAQGSVRLSLSTETTFEELDIAVSEIKKQVAFLKKFKRR